ncbi:MAG: DNA polymerase III subunit beta [Candidatus Margulisiibacteriota bacterium]|nr:DNA polymerase III subunit beta [Candidatus Margulisiibacteriota bacterium]
MELKCDKKDLQIGVAAVEKIVTTRSTLPIIGYILFEAGKNGLKLSANNLEMGIELDVRSEVGKDGSILVPAKTLGGIVSKLPETKVEFKLTEKGTVRITYDKSYFNVHTLPPDEFPVLPKVKNGKSFTIAAGVLANMIKQTIFAASGSEDKYVLTGVLMEFGKGSLPGDQTNIGMIATDGYRLAKRGEKVKLPDGIKGSMIVPAKAFQEIYRILELDNEDGEVEVTFSAEQISFKYNGVYLVSRLIQGQFPDYKQVLPKKSSTIITLKTRDLLRAAERTAVIASGSANIVRFEIKNEKLHLFASTPDVGTVDEELDADIKGAGNNQIAFNIRLITDVLKVIDTPEVIIELTESLGPGVIRQPEKGEYLYIVMPIRTQEVV